MCASCAATAKSLEDFVREEFGRRDALQKHQLSMLPLYVDEYQYVSSASTLTLQPQSYNDEIIRSIVAYVQNGPATLTLGSRTLTIPSGLFTLSHISFILRSADVRSLVQQSAGTLSLELMGEEIPTDLRFSSW